MCVCVKHLNRCKTSIYLAFWVLHYQIQFSVSFLAGGPSMYCVRWSNEAATVHADITADHRDVPANPFQKWQAATPRTAMSNFWFSTNELQSISELIALQSYQFLARCPVLFCTNDTFQVNNSKSFSKQVCPSCRLDKMVGTPRGMSFQAILSTFDLISEFTHFNLVIRFK